jgi:hypothetical protein
MVAFEVFRSLGVKYHIRPVLEHMRQHNDDDEYYAENPDLLTHNHVVHDFAAPICTGCQFGDGGNIADVYDAVPNELVKIAWMNDPTNGTENMQFAYDHVSCPHCCQAHCTDPIANLVRQRAQYCFWL